MTPELDEVMREAERAGQSTGDRLLGELAERLGAHASARSVFGEATTQDGVTVIPVAKVRYGFGGGGGRGSQSAEDGYSGGEGSGGGGGVTAAPLGYIELRAGEARFVRVKDPSAWLPVLAVGAVSAWVVSRALRALFR